MTDPTQYPLAWPPGWPRTPRHQRQRASFGTTSRNDRNGPKKAQPLTVAEALDRLQRQVDYLGARYAVISTNVEIKLSGLPRSGQPEPGDVGVAVYFQLKGRATAMPCDRWDRVADNIAAVAAHIDAVRRIDRYGVGTVEQMFTGFQAIRGPGPKPWREVLGIPPQTACTVAYVMDQYRDLARKHHPDAGGSEAMMAEINAARDAARKELVA